MDKKQNETKYLDQIRLLEAKIGELKEQLHEQKERSLSLDEIIAIMPGHVYWKDKDGLMLGCNNEQARSAGLTDRAEIRGLRPIDIIRPDQPEDERIKQAQAIEQVDRDVIDNQKVVLTEETAVLEDGSTGYFLSKKTPLYDDSGEVKGLVGVTLDISQQRSSTSKSKFIINLAALMRDALSPITAATDLLRTSPLSDSQLKTLSIIADSQERTLPLIEKLYDYVELEDGDLPVINSEFELQKLIDSVVSECQDLIAAKSLEVKVNVTQDFPKTIICPKYSLMQGIGLILDDIIKNESKGNSLDIYAKIKDKSNVVITISSPGLPVSAEALENLFQLFDGEGNLSGDLFAHQGLQLSIASKFLRHAGAQIEVQGREAGGVDFIISLRLRHQELSSSNYTVLEHSSPSLDFDDEPTTSSLPNKHIKILILDRDCLWQSALSEILNSEYDCTIEQVVDVNVQPSTLNNLYDIIFTDVGSIDGDFLNFAANYVREHESKVPVIVTTACATDEQRELINRSGVTDILLKPAGVNDIISLVDYYVFHRT